MNWEAIGAVGEIVGALAVVLTLVVLVVQVRHSTRVMGESNQFQRSAALDRHSDSISRWRGRLMEHSDLAEIWLAGRNDTVLDEVARLRLSNLWIDFMNTQRSNFARANTVGDTGLAEQAVLSIVAEINQSTTFKKEWETMRPWMELTSPDFAEKIASGSAAFRDGADQRYRVTRVE